MSPRNLPPLSTLGRSALWTLHSRTAFPEVLHDPVGASIRERFGQALSRSFGRPERSFADRARRFDAELQAFLHRHPGAAVVSLGEGLETQRFRVEGYGSWVSVDLAEILSVRERFMPPDAMHRHRSASATDLGWLDDLGEGPAYVVAQGLFMYLEPDEVGEILAALGARGQVELMFDIVPGWVAALSRLRPPMARTLEMPRMPWGATEAALQRRIRAWAGSGASVRTVPVALPSGPLPGPPPGLGWTVAAVVSFGGG